MSRLAAALAEAGGVDAPVAVSARLRDLLLEELRRGADELGRARTGYPDPIAVALAPGEREMRAVCPVAPELRADPARAGEREWLLVAALVGALVDAAHPGVPTGATALALTAGQLDGWLALVYPVRSGEEADAAELAAGCFDEQAAGVDRLRARGLVLPGHVLDRVADLRSPIGDTQPLRIAEAVARLGGRPAEEQSLEEHEETVLALLGPAKEVARAHADPDPARRLARRILQRLDGMGKWGGYHTEFAHLARGVVGNDKALALKIGERLVAAGLLVEKPSAGQRHVFLNPRRSGDIHALIDEGRVPGDLKLPDA